MVRSVGRVDRFNVGSSRSRTATRVGTGARAPKRGVRAGLGNGIRTNDFHNREEIRRPSSVRARRKSDIQNRHFDDFTQNFGGLNPRRSRVVSPRKQQKTELGSRPIARRDLNARRGRQAFGARGEADNFGNPRAFRNSFKERAGDSRFESRNTGDNVFDKYLKQRENPLNAFKDLAGTKFKDVFASSRVNFENPFEVQGNNKDSNIFEKITSNKKEQKGNVFERSQFDNPFAEFMREQKNNQNPSQNVPHEEEMHSNSGYGFFNPFDGVKPSGFAEEKNPTDLFSFSRGKAKIEDNAHGQQEFKQEDRPLEEGSAYETILNNTVPPLQNSFTFQEQDKKADEYDEVLEYDETAELKSDNDDTFVETEDKDNENEFFDHALIADSEELNNKEQEGEESDETGSLSDEEEQEPAEDEEFKEYEKRGGSVVSTISTVVFSVAAVLFVTYMLFFYNVEKKGVAPDVSDIRPVKIFTVKETNKSFDVISTRVFPAQVVSFKDIDVSFKLSGRVKKIHVKEGDYVKKGQIIATLDNIDYKYNVERIEPNLKKVEAEYKRAKELFKEQVASKAYLEEVEDKYFTVKRNYDYAKTQLAETVLKSPYSGTILSKLIEDEEYVNPGAVVVSISSSDKIEIESFFTEKVIQAVVQAKPKNYTVKVSFSSSDDKFYNVELSEFSSVIDPVTQSYRVKYVMNRPKNVDIFAGMIAYLRVEPNKNLTDSKKTAKKSQIFVPLSAVTNSNNQDFVWVVNKESNKVGKRVVELGEMSSGNVLVKSGLENGDVIVKAGVAFLKEGQKINVLSD